MGNSNESCLAGRGDGTVWISLTKGDSHPKGSKEQGDARFHHAFTMYHFRHFYFLTLSTQYFQTMSGAGNREPGKHRH